MMKKRVLGGALALLLALGCALPAGAYDIPAGYDETYYATLDYYGAPTQASVVKSYRLNGQTTVTDYGDYDEVINLTDGAVPTVSGGKVTFTPEETSAGKFYFQGVTQKPFEQLPWSIAVSYKRNGAPVRAEDLGGAAGLIEIDLDVTPNAGASQYSKSNLVLTAATAFNDDDITSLAAPGAEVQLIGNLRAVLFMVLPGEEQHFSIQVGTESFSFPGLMLLAVPATLGQLDQVSRLRQVKEDAEDSLDAANDALDAMLDALEGMSGSLNATASGLDRLNAARGTVSARKDDFYAAADGLHDLQDARSRLSAGWDGLSQSAGLALDSLDGLTAALAALDPYSAVLSAALDDANATLNELNTTLQTLGPQLTTARAVIVKLQADADDLTELLGDMERFNTDASLVADDLVWATEDLHNDAWAMYNGLQALERALRLTTGMGALTAGDLAALLSADEQAQLQQVLALRGQYEAYLRANSLTESQLGFADFIVAAAYQQFCQQTVQAAVEANAPAAVEQAAAQFTQENGRAPTQEELAAIQAQVVEALTAAATAQLPTLEEFKQAPAAQETVAQAQAAEEAYTQYAQKLAVLDVANGKIREVNTVLTNITKPTAQVVEELSELCGGLVNTGLAEDVTNLTQTCRDLLDALAAHKGEGAAAAGHLNEVGDLAARLTQTADDLLGNVDALTALLNTYTPQARSAIADVAALSASAQTALGSTSAALRQGKEVLGGLWPSLDAGTEKTLGGLSSAVDAMRDSGSALDQGTQATLSGLSAALRQATLGLGQSDTVRNARDTVEDMVEEQWDAHSGQIDTLLYIDPAAAPESMTSARNPAPGNVQYIMRTQEIEPAQDAPAAQAERETAPKTTLWERILALFRGIWEAIVGLFKH